MRALVIVNPVAGNGRTARVWSRIRPDVDGLSACECVASERVGHARELAQSAVQAGYERVIVVGGDGTVCEVASGVAHTPTAVAVIPAGTGNDCCRNLSIPTDVLAAADGMAVQSRDPCQQGDASATVLARQKATQVRCARS